MGFRVRLLGKDRCRLAFGNRPWFLGDLAMACHWAVTLRNRSRMEDIIDYLGHLFETFDGSSIPTAGIPFDTAHHFTSRGIGAYAAANVGGVLEFLLDAEGVVQAGVLVRVRQ